MSGKSRRAAPAIHDRSRRRNFRPPSGITPLSNRTVEQVFKLVCASIEGGRFDEATALCRQILAAEPSHRETLLLLSTIAQRNGNPAEADDWLHRAVTSTRDTAPVSHLLEPQPRWAPHAGLAALLEKNLDRYRATLASFERYRPWLEKIPREENARDAEEPYWNNIWLPPLDAVALYCLVAEKKPRRYIEIGSGNSTKFVARAIADHKLDTEIISIDPQPRAEIDALCDQVLRSPLEHCDLGVFGTLGAGDLVFADNSHQSFMNSDVTVFFCEILPQLARGVIAGVHDIFLPDDYPAHWTGRYYSEQYLLACYLLAETRRFDVLLPVHFANAHSLCTAVMPQPPGSGALMQTGSSFWLQMQ